MPSPHKDTTRQRQLAEERFGRPEAGWRLRVYMVIFESDTRAGRAFDITLLTLILISVAVVMLDVLDCGDPDRVARRKALYESYGFEPLPSNPLRMFLSVSTVRKLIAEEDYMLKKDAALADLARLGQDFDRG